MGDELLLLSEQPSKFLVPALHAAHLSGKRLHAVAETGRPRGGGLRLLLLLDLGHERGKLGLLGRRQGTREHLLAEVI
jgi:hypothetical protein